MMKNITDAETQPLLDELKEVLEKVRKCDCVFTLKQFLQRSDGELNQMDIQQKIFTDMSVTVYINDRYVYAAFNSENEANLKQIRAMWETVLKRGTQCTLEGKPNDYAVITDLIKQELENSLAYTLSFINPVFVSIEDKTATLAYDIDSMFFGKETVTLDEIEYMEELDKDRYTETEQEDVYSETDEFIGTDEYIS